MHTKIIVGDIEYGSRCSIATFEAIAEGKGIQWEDIQKDITLISSQGMILTIKEKQTSLRKERVTLSRETIENEYADDKEYDRLVELSNGCPQTAHQDFIPNNGENIKERSIPEFPHMNLTIGIHLAAEHRRGHSIIVPLELAKKTCEKEGIILHVSEMFVRDKPDAPLGRPIPDYSFSRHGPAMSHKDLKPVLAHKWGALQHPTISDICTAMTNARLDACGQKVVGARTDIKAAYTRILMSPNDCAMMAKLITRDGINGGGPLVSIPIVNQWGSQPAGYAFDVPTRVLRTRAHARAKSSRIQTIIYVDDHLNFGKTQCVKNEVNRFMSDARELLGHDATSKGGETSWVRVNVRGGQTGFPASSAPFMSMNMR